MAASGKTPKRTASKAKPAAVKKTTTKTKSASAPRKRSTKPKATKMTTKSAAATKTTTKSKKKPPVMASGAAPMVDTSFAAESAARMLATRAKLAKAAGGAAPSDAGATGSAADHPRESGAFKQMKENLNKPSAGGISSAMGNTFGPNKTNLPNPDKGHVVHDQTTSNVNRINVPRRTGG
jgi:hypothetical protein